MDSCFGQRFGNVASGTWQTTQTKKRKKIASWTDDVTGESILFEFRKSGRIKIYSDQNGNGKINRRKDVLIGDDKYSTSFDKRYYRRNHFFKKIDSGEFEIEVEGFCDDSNKYQAFYVIRLDSGVDSENFAGTLLDVNKFVDVKNNDILTSVFQPEVI